MGNSVANIRLRRRSHILPIYCANVGSVANILPILWQIYGPRNHFWTGGIRFIVLVDENIEVMKI